MSVADDPNPEPVIFSAIITPHRSLGRAGFIVVMLLVGGLSFCAGLAFFLEGAWPIVGFCGLDVLLVYWAFRANYRAAAAFEEVTVTQSVLTVRKVSPRGVVREWQLNPVWATLNREGHAEFGIERLFLVSRGRSLDVASFLGPAEKESFASALSAALGTAKRGLTRTVFE